MNRKEFIRLSASAALLLANGKIIRANEITAEALRARTLFRFAVASDGHYGEKGTDYENHFANLLSAINTEHRNKPFQFAVVNGDIVHDDKTFYPQAKAALDELDCRYYVSQGNHDHVTAEEWESIWHMPVNLDFTVKKCAFLVATTSNVKGEYLCPDINWLTSKMDEHRNKEIFIFIHINPGKLTKHAVDCPALFELLKKHSNVRAIFNGHDHDEDGIKMRDDVPFVFDAHFGGSWGTAYRGYRVVEVKNDGSVVTFVKTPLEEINRAEVGRREKR